MKRDESLLGNIDWGLFYNSNYPFEHKPIINLIQQIHKKYKIELNNKSVKNKAWYNINLELNSFSKTRHIYSKNQYKNPWDI